MKFYGKDDLNNHNCLEDIDVVILWVDGEDPEWINIYNKFADVKKSKSERFRDWDTIRYVFRGIEKFMPWVRNIHFVTCGQKPSWMVDLHPKLKFVSHEDIFPDPSVLPVFNASAIEMNLANVPNIADKFIYFNDDTLVLQDTPVNRFFENSLPVDFLIQSMPRRGWLYEKLRKPDSWPFMIMNSVNVANDICTKEQLLLNKPGAFYSKYYPLSSRIKNRIYNHIFDDFRAFEHFHHPQSYLKSTLVKVNEVYGDQVKSTISSRFRHRTNLSQAVFRYAQLVTGCFIPKYYHDHACINVDSVAKAKLCADAITSYRFVCVNDKMRDTETEYEYCRTLVIDALNKILPEKSSFEK